MIEEHRQHLALWMDRLVQKRANIHYVQHRPMATAHWYGHPRRLWAYLEAGGHLSMDCSESVTLLCNLAGLHDPNGRHYDGWGNTETLYAHLGGHAYTDASEARIGALLLEWGPFVEQHVCATRHPAKDPIVFSHGGEPGPIYIRASEENTYHPHCEALYLPITSLIPK